MPQSQRTLYRLFYRSRQMPDVVAETDLVVSRIIASSIARNRSVGLTGLLLVVKGHFVQALEGGIDPVRDTYARISMDTRHKDLHIISQGVAERRLFGDWNMCASSLAPSDEAILNVLDGKNFKPEALTAASTQRLLITVADIQRRTALSAMLG